MHEILEITVEQIEGGGVSSITMHGVQSVEIKEDFVPVHVIVFLNTVAFEEEVFVVGLT